MTLIAAHRGASAIAPENTLEAFEAAIAVGADMVEFDVRSTADGVLVVTHDPLVLEFGRRNVYVDLGAELPIAAEKDGRKIAVEIKSFTGPSEMTELERALGQHTLYRFLLSRAEPERILYLAVSESAFLRVFDEPDARDLIASEQVRVLVFDVSEEAISRWID